MTRTNQGQPVTVDQLARLYQARNEANKRMSQALRGGDKMVIRLATSEASNFNRAYDDARRAFKRQQKAERREQLRTSMIRFYMDYLDAHQQQA